MIKVERTREAALEVLLALREKMVERDDYTEYPALLTGELLKTVFDYAWHLQFDEDRTAVRRKIRQVVNDSIEEQSL